MTLAKVLVVDDERSMRATLAMILRSSNYEVLEAATAEQAAGLAQVEMFDVVLSDMRMGATNSGLDVLRAVKSSQPSTEVILMTAYGTIESAVEAMRFGAADYLQKPFSEKELLVKIERAVSYRKMNADLASMASELRDRYKLENIVGRSVAIREMLGRIVRFATTDAGVLISGESGTGKELIARAIHANSKRATKAFVPVNCAAVPEPLIESELFGHAKGAFTGANTMRKGLFEEADGGTLFLDEVGDMPLFSQVKLLRAIQEGEIRRVGENKPVQVDVRILAASNIDLKRAVEEKRFRQDLYYRLNVAQIEVPALRDRKSDIPELVRFFLDKHNKRMHASAKIDEVALEALLAYDFPGNVRELEHMIEQAIANVQTGIIRREELFPFRFIPKSKRDLAAVVDDAERVAIEVALREFGGNREKVAEELGISVTTLWRKMTRHGVQF